MLGGESARHGAQVKAEPDGVWLIPGDREIAEVGRRIAHALVKRGGMLYLASHAMRGWQGRANLKTLFAVLRPQSATAAGKTG
jgi:hypothetical protein